MELGWLGIAIACLVLAILMRFVGRLPERPGAYLVGVGLTGLVFLVPLLARMPECPVHGPLAHPCYAAGTIPAIFAYLAAVVAGALLMLAPGLRRR